MFLFAIEKFVIFGAWIFGSYVCFLVNAWFPITLHQKLHSRLSAEARSHTILSLGFKQRLTVNNSLWPLKSRLVVRISISYHATEFWWLLFQLISTEYHILTVFRLLKLSWIYSLSLVHRGFFVPQISMTWFDDHLWLRTWCNSSIHFNLVGSSNGKALCNICCRTHIRRFIHFQIILYCCFLSIINDNVSFR